MDRMERLNLLFQGDEDLLQKRSGIYADSHSSAAMGEQATSVVPNTKVPATSGEPTAQSDSEDGFDEYLKYFADTAKKNARRQAAGNERKARVKKGNHGARENIRGGVVSGDNWLNGASEMEMGGPIPPFFCPAIPLSRFPYKYVSRELSDSIAKRFFDGGKFWNRSWELYYVHPPPDISNRPILLIPASQAQELIATINKALQCDISIPSDSDEGLLLPFAEDGTPQPKFLGLSTSREMKEQLEQRIEPPVDGEHLPPDECTPAMDRSFAAFRQKMEAAVDAARKKNKASKAKKRETQIQKQQDWCRSLKRLQCYLGLLRRYPRGDDTAAQEQDERNYGPDYGTVAQSLDVNKPVAFLFDREPIFISVDVESNERSHTQITEIGVSTLDTRDLVGIPPGEGAMNWLTKIRARHFRISEYSYVVNRDFVRGCPDKFEFGTSEWVSLKEAAKTVDACFQPPYSAQVNTPDPGVTKERNNNLDSSDSEGGGVPLDPTLLVIDKLLQGKDVLAEEPRNIILLGHDTQADVAYLRSLGCTTFGAQLTPTEGTPGNHAPKNEQSAGVHFLEALDTATLYRALKREPHNRSLGHILLDFGLTGWNLHNAGNDAYYTMQCMIGLALKSYSQLHGSTTDETQTQGEQQPTTDRAIKTLDGNVDTPTHDPDWDAEVARRIAETVEESKARVIEECEGWSIAMGRDGNRCVDDIDGGDAKGVDFTPPPEKGRRGGR
ncbi:hypothetical protein FQN54_005072 [Arachnomyces sp. PD_36]|nr:hypothetical protein FQN54_005072 [Arachnomyces sp. PD_36]